MFIVLLSLLGNVVNHGLRLSMNTNKVKNPLYWLLIYRVLVKIALSANSPVRYEHGNSLAYCFLSLKRENFILLKILYRLFHANRVHNFLYITATTQQPPTEYFP